MSVLPIICMVSWKVLKLFDRLSMISSWVMKRSSISFSRVSLIFWNSIMAFFWNSSMYLCWSLSYLVLVSRNRPRVRLLSVRSLSIFLPRSYFSLSNFWRMSFSRSILVWTSPSKRDCSSWISSLVSKMSSSDSVMRSSTSLLMASSSLFSRLSAALNYSRLYKRMAVILPSSSSRSSRNLYSNFD